MYHWCLPDKIKEVYIMDFIFKIIFILTGIGFCVYFGSIGFATIYALVSFVVSICQKIFGGK